MPSPALKHVSKTQDNTHTASLCGWEWGGTGYGGGKVTQERMTEADAAKVAAKKETEKNQIQTKTRLTKKECRKNHALSRLIPPPVFFLDIWAT